MTQTLTNTPSKNAGNVQEYESYSSQNTDSARDNDEALEALKTHLADRYHIIKNLGKGSQGSVFLAKSHETHQKVAIKQLHISSVKDWKQYDLFQREANVLKRLDIPGVAKLHETIEMLDIPTPMALIVQDYIEGDPLQQFIAQGHRFQIQQIGSILLQLLDILQKLHESEPQVIHRDIKPSNILLNYTENSQTPEVHLIDFGAVSNPQVKGGGSTVVGTYGYMSPEQLMGRACPASDLYSLAIVTVYLLSGVPPEELEIQDYHVLIDSHLEHLPYAITAFLRKMLEPRVENRMTDYEQIRKFLTALKSQKFDEIPKVNDSKSQKKYSLDEVYSYHQTGNIVLWQELKDATPRPLPGRYKRKFIRELFPNLLRDLCIRHSFREIISMIIMSIISLAILLFFITVLIFYVDDIYGLILCIIMIASSSLFQETILSVFIQSLKDIYHPYSFIKHARKSMATVIRVEYISCYSRWSIKFSRTYRPTWLITYCFNPPDDSSPNDLIRTVETHAKPDVKEGDLIPILYRIQNKEYVYSTPYPVPVSDEFKPSDK